MRVVPSRGKFFPLFLGAIVFLCTQSACTGFFFYPSRALFHTPSEFGLQFEEFTLPSLDETKLLAWWLPAQGQEKGTILFLHGNAENISTHVAAVAWLPKVGYSVLLFDYRGYGASEGSPSMDGALLDVEAAIRYLAVTKGRRFHFFGQSLGASLGVLALKDSAHQEAIQSITLEGGFSSFRKIIADKLGEFWLLWPIQWLPGLFVPTPAPADLMKQLPRVPLLIMHGDEDEIVPAYHACKLFEQACPPKEFISIPGGGHVDAFSRQEYRDRYQEFLARAESAGERGSQPPPALSGSAERGREIGNE